MNILKFLFLGVLLIPVLAFAAAPGGNATVDNVDAVTNYTLTDIYNTFVTGANWFLAFVAIIAIVILIYSGFLFMTAGGEEEKISSAKKNLQYGLIGMGVAILAFSVIKLVGTFLSSGV